GRMPDRSASRGRSRSRRRVRELADAPDLTVLEGEPLHAPEVVLCSGRAVTAPLAEHDDYGVSLRHQSLHLGGLLLEHAEIPGDRPRDFLSAFPAPHEG